MVTKLRSENKQACCGTDEAALREATPTTDERLTNSAALFKALSDETRLRILHTMVNSRRDICECEIVPLFGLSQSTISYHLKVLRDAGIVECEKRGLWAYCRVNPRALLTGVKTLAELA
jgi:ArsR family transcriptional regulator